MVPLLLIKMEAINITSLLPLEAMSLLATLKTLLITEETRTIERLLPQDLHCLTTPNLLPRRRLELLRLLLLTVILETFTIARTIGERIDSLIEEEGQEAPTTITNRHRSIHLPPPPHSLLLLLTVVMIVEEKIEMIEEEEIGLETIEKLIIEKMIAEITNNEETIINEEMEIINDEMTNEEMTITIINNNNNEEMIDAKEIINEEVTLEMIIEEMETTTDVTLEMTTEETISEEMIIEEVETLEMIIEEETIIDDIKNITEKMEEIITNIHNINQSINPTLQSMHRRMRRGLGLPSLLNNQRLLWFPRLVLLLPLHPLEDPMINLPNLYQTFLSNEEDIMSHHRRVAEDRLLRPPPTEVLLPLPLRVLPLPCTP